MICELSTSSVRENCGRYLLSVSSLFIYCVSRRSLLCPSTKATCVAFGLAFAILILPAGAKAQQEEKDILFLTGKVDSVSSSTGVGGGIEWQRKISPGSGLTLGGFSFTQDGSSWAYGKVGGYVKLRDKSYLSGDVSVGGGKRRGKGFTYQKYRVGITQGIIDKRLYVEAENLYSRINKVEENRVKTGVIVFPTPSIETRLSYNFSTGGNVSTNFVLAKADVKIKKINAVGAVLVGRATPEMFGRITDANSSERTTQFGTTVFVPVGKNKMFVGYDQVRQLGTTRHTMTVGWRLPLPRRR